MASKKYAVTRADAIAFAMERCVDNPDVVEVLANLHKQFTTRKSTTGVKSKARLINEDLAQKVYDNVLASDIAEGIDTHWICGNVPGIDTPQKATAVMRVAVELGKFDKVVIPHGSRNEVRYTVK